MAEETQEQKDERMAWELFPDIPRSSELRAESAEHRLAEALQLLEAAKDCLPFDDLVYLRIRDFLDQK